MVMHLPALFTMEDNVLAEAKSLLVTIVSNNSIKVLKYKETRHTQKVTEETGRETNKYYTQILAYAFLRRRFSASLVSIHRGLASGDGHVATSARRVLPAAAAAQPLPLEEET